MENKMGNTNLPQFGAAGVKNSRDTLSGEQQLTQDERKAAGIGPSPSRPKNAPERIPGQQRDPDDADDVEGGADDREKRDHDNDVERPDETGQPEDVTGSEPVAAFGGHANTGHSPSGAT
jgi:hypothetical protein